MVFLQQKILGNVVFIWVSIIHSFSERRNEVIIYKVLGSENSGAGRILEARVFREWITFFLDG